MRNFLNITSDRRYGAGNLQFLALSFSFGKLVQRCPTKLINLQTVCTEKITHGLPNHRLGHFIAARLLWAAGYVQAIIRVGRKNYVKSHCDKLTN